jgi:inosose dehydratase
MNYHPKHTRRNFLAKAGTGALALTTLSSFRSSLIPVNQKDETNVNLGIAGYTFQKFDLDKSLDMMNRVGAKFLSIKSFHLPLESTAEQIYAFHEKLAARGIKGYCVGPIYMHSEEEINKAFEYTKRVGVDLMVGVPDYNLLSYTEKKVKEYGIRVAIHNHGPDNLGYPTATDIMNRVGGMDKRMGICLDIGHNLRGGENPAYALKKFGARIFDMHLKDVTAASKEGKNIELGRGIINFSEFFRALIKYKYKGVCSIEYEKEMSDPLPGIAESIGYAKGVISTL